ncbi:MAG: hypothetical protein QW057_10630 [Candidatus Bathyarchaeia archaeon]
MKRMPLFFAMSVASASSIGVFLARNVIELLLCVELISIASLYLFFVVVVPAVFPRRVDAETVFLGGAAKPPYVFPEEVYRPTYSSLIPHGREKREQER